ncbi:hypothetical protein NKJ06_18905 [Mesorhizobium sp. M0293]|uniref:hypothetical protein n=1 Tax=Mesorhizobium sp. M0293 TaxID=2956930 RepID=UPI003337653F
MQPAQIFKRVYWHDAGHPEVSYEVLVDGEKYVCDAVQLERLYEGVLPANLDLVRVPEEDE